MAESNSPGRPESSRSSRAEPKGRSRGGAPADDDLAGAPIGRPDLPAPIGGGSGATLLQTIKAISSALFGVRSSKGHQADLRLSPLRVIIAGLVALVLFIGLLLFLARMMIRLSGTA